MRNLYSSLLTYKAKEGRTPLEEFTSGALADLLSRMNTDTLAAFFRLFKAWDSAPLALPCGLNARAILWQTEHSVWSQDSRWGRADVIGLVNGKPAIIIENKLSAAVSDTQIGLYREALEAGGSSQPLLLFLTATTDPPQDFLEAQPHGVTFGTSRWAAVYQYLSSIASNAEDAPAIAALSFEFSEFLKQQELHMDVMSPRDTAVLHLWLTAKDRVDNTVLAIFNPICSRLAPWRKGTRGSNLSDDGDTFAYNAAFRIDGGERWAYVEAGIVYPDQSEWWAVADKTAPQAVVFIYDHNEAALPQLAGLDWARSDTGDQIAIMCNLDELLHNPLDAHAKLTNWATSMADQLVKALPSPA